MGRVRDEKDLHGEVNVDVMGAPDKKTRRVYAGFIIKCNNK